MISLQIISIEVTRISTDLAKTAQVDGMSVAVTISEHQNCQTVLQHHEDLDYCYVEFNELIREIVFSGNISALNAVAHR